MGAEISFPSVQLPDDRVFLITGANTGIGYETAKQIAMMGGHVIMACRNTDKAEAAIKKMQQEFQEVKKDGKLNVTERNQLNVENMRLDLSSFKSTMQFITKFKETQRRLHVLICNAGIGFVQKSYTDDGYESMFQINYLSHFLLIAHLLPILQQSGDDCRIVLVSSIAHKWGRFNMATAQAKEIPNFNRIEYYGNSKMYQVMMMYSLVRRLQGTRISVTSLHPGIVDTELLRNCSDHFIYKNLFNFSRILGKCRNPSQGAVTSINCAVSPDLRGVTGVYFEDAKRSTPSRDSRNVTYQDELWKYTLDCLKSYLPIDFSSNLPESSDERIQNGQIRKT